VLELTPSNDFLLETTCPCLPLFCLLNLGLEGASKLFALELPLLLFFELLVEFELSLPVSRILLILIFEDFVEAYELLVE
jgi:hypothetical protein